MMPSSLSQRRRPIGSYISIEAIGEGGEGGDGKGRWMDAMMNTSL